MVLLLSQLHLAMYSSENNIGWGLIWKDVAAYLDDIIPPVLGCFSDQDSRLRYYALESMYNIAKVAKGEILLYFNEVFDALCKVYYPSEYSNF